MPLSTATREKLKTVSTATIATALFKRGLRTQMIQGVRPLDPAKPTMVGEAFTLRYIRRGKISIPSPYSRIAATRSAKRSRSAPLERYS